MNMRFLISFLICFVITIFSYAEELKEYFIRENTFLYFYLNAEKVQNSKIYASADKYLLQDNYKNYSNLRKAALKIGITEKDISEIYFLSSLKNVKAINDIKQDTVYYLSGTVLKKEITSDKLLGILKESLKDEPSVKINKIKKFDNDIIQVKNADDFLYINIPQSRLILASSNMTELITFMRSYKTKKINSSSNNMSEILSQVSSSSSLYSAIALPSFMIEEFQKINGKVKQDETEDVQNKLNNAIRNLKGATVEVKTEDTLILKINIFFAAESGAKSFNELLNQFLPLLKFQLFIMVQNNTLPVLNTITTGISGNIVSLSFVLTNDDFVSIGQMIRNKGKVPGL